MNKVIITRIDERIVTALMEEGKIVELSCEYEDRRSLLGNIYTGKVTNIVKNIHGAFVEIADGIVCYYSLDENKRHIYTGVTPNRPLAAGDEILVQISRDDIKTKQPAATSNINLPGRYIVLTADKHWVGVSSKIKSEERRKQLKELVKTVAREDFGLIVRTNATEASDEEILTEAKNLVDLYDQVISFGRLRTAKQLVYEAPEGYLALIRDQRDLGDNEIITDQKDVYDRVKSYLSINGGDTNALKFHEGEIDLNRIYRIGHDLEEALGERVWLKSGGYLVIQPTEALTVIDVNTGKAIKGKHQEKHFLKTNLEAAEEVARQLRMRNLSGIIIVDFIDLKMAESEETLMKKLGVLLAKDRIKTQLIDMTRLHLVEITRKKVRKPLLEQWKEKR